MSLDPYPTKEELKKIKNWDVSRKRDVLKLIDFIQYLWWPDQKLEISGKYVINIEMHTWGWSGNECIIGELRENRAFWELYWEKETNGAHYYFKIDLR